MQTVTTTTTTTTKASSQQSHSSAVHSNVVTEANGGVSTSYGVRSKRKFQESFEEAPLWAAIITIAGYLLLNVFGWIRDFLRHVGIEKKKGAKDNNPEVSIVKNSHLIYMIKMLKITNYIPNMNLELK